MTQGCECGGTETLVSVRNLSYVTTYASCAQPIIASMIAREGLRWCAAAHRQHSARVGPGRAAPAAGLARARARLCLKFYISSSITSRLRQLGACGRLGGPQKLAPRFLHSWRHPCTAQLLIGNSYAEQLRIDKINIVVGSGSELTKFWWW